MNSVSAKNELYSQILAAGEHEKFPANALVVFNAGHFSVYEYDRDVTVPGAIGTAKRFGGSWEACLSYVQGLCA